uniref:Uncharacterized protein n=1 Tax=Fagus sylvatica TaxID=28930 RepID=A0A2N9FIW4_FAGSY
MFRVNPWVVDVCRGPCDWVVVMLRGCDDVVGFLPCGLMPYDSMAVGNCVVFVMWVCVQVQ